MLLTDSFFPFLFGNFTSSAELAYTFNTIDGRL